MSKKELKTNAMRILDRNKIPYEYETYECDEFVDGITTADKIGLPHEQVYKTLVLHGNRNEEAISDCDRFQCTASGIHLCKWREDWNADQIETG